MMNFHLLHMIGQQEAPRRASRLVYLPGAAVFLPSKVQPQRDRRMVGGWAIVGGESTGDWGGGLLGCT